jgi:hypothetical protein
MKTDSLIKVLLTVSGIGLVAFILWEILKAKPSAKSPTANPGTASPFAALYNGFGKLFGGQKQTDNTGALITSSGQAATSIFGSLGKLFPTGGTPVASPVNLTTADLTLVGGSSGGGSDFSAGQDPSGFN